MSWNNASHTPTIKTVDGASRYPRTLVWGASMIWEGDANGEVSAAPARRKHAAGRERKPAAPRLVHALLGAFFGLGR